MGERARASRGAKKPTEDLSLQKMYLGKAFGIMTRRRLNDDRKRAACREGRSFPGCENELRKTQTREQCQVCDAPCNLGAMLHSHETSWCRPDISATRESEAGEF